jgi:hypothetical protein
MSFVPVISAILGAVIGGVFLLGGQRYNEKRLWKMAGKLLFYHFYREAAHTNNLIKTILANNANHVIPIVELHISLERYFEIEHDLMRCTDISTVDAIYFMVMTIDNWQKRLFEHKRIDDIDITYGMLCDIQKNILDILEVVVSAIKFDRRKEIIKARRTITMLRESFDKFDQRPRDFRFSLISPTNNNVNVDQFLKPHE